MSIQKRYTREILEGLQYFPTWLPIVPIEIGQIGRVDGSTLVRAGHLKDKQVKISYGVTRGAPRGSIKYVSSKDVTVDFKASGEIPATGSKLTKASAGVTVHFGAKHGILFEADGCLIESIEDQTELGATLLRRYRAGKWDKEQFVVTEVVRATATTVLISSAKDARIELATAAKVRAASTSLASLDAGFKVAVSSKLGTEIVATRGLTPLFRAARVRTTWYGKAYVDNRGHISATTRPDEPVDFSPLRLADLWPDD